MGKTVLVIEDNQDNRDIILEFLSAYGFDVLSAVDGQEGINIFMTNRPDLVLSDVLLPKVNGFGVCQTIKNDDNPVPVILMSALYKTHALQAEAREKYGADDYMLKPLNLVKLSERICKILKISKCELGKPEEKSRAEEIEDGIPNSGSLKDVPAIYLITHYFQKKVTGILSCNDIYKKTLYYNKGLPIFVNSDNPTETYAALLVKEGLITEDQKTEYEAKAKAAKSTIGKELISGSVISNKELALVMNMEVEERLSDLVSWTDGTYSFAKGDSFLKKIKRPPMAFAKAVYKGIMQANLYDLVLKRYEKQTGNAVKKIEEKLMLVGEIDMDMVDLQTFALIDGEKTLAEIIIESGLDTDRVMKTVFSLEVLGIIVIEES